MSSFPPFLTLHAEQAVTTLSQWVSPPFDLGNKAAMLCTASVEEVIDEHYLHQIKQLDNSEPKLKKKIIKFREDELSHKDIAYEKGATKEGPYSILDKIIKTGSKIAINISEKI